MPPLPPIQLHATSFFSFLCMILVWGGMGAFYFFIKNRQAAREAEDEWETDWEVPSQSASSNSSSSTNANAGGSRKAPREAAPDPMAEMRARLKEAIERQKAIDDAREQSVRQTDQSRRDGNRERESAHSAAAQATYREEARAYRANEAATQAHRAAQAQAVHDMDPGPVSTPLTPTMRVKKKKKTKLTTDREAMRRAFIMREVLDRPRCFDI